MLINTDCAQTHWVFLSAAAAKSANAVNGSRIDSESEFKAPESAGFGAHHNPQIDQLHCRARTPPVIHRERESERITLFEAKNRSC